MYCLPCAITSACRASMQVTLLHHHASELANALSPAAYLPAAKVARRDRSRLQARALGDSLQARRLPLARAVARSQRQLI